MGGGGEKVPGQYMGWWGSFGSPPQKGITTYTLSANRQRPLAGTMHAAVFNSWRRFKGQVLYVAPPFVVAYLVMDWAVKENHFLNSKEGRRLHGAEED
ncbi:cytochrome b-c1 complex subunit 8 [Tuber borchii]|uniref:Cytochrome b-c1 complex subunit 8 n=1 Tax=Tuber borchii TaxID=42251 RepID=A0A2T6ZGD3_TUBBO|nr:cytochrome b-c1 complex subunit 8 [Tuber borchii]